MAGIRVFLFFVAWLPSSVGLACSAFVLQNQNDRFIGKNFDWTDGSGYLLTNPRAEKKNALPTQFNQTPLSWISLYGSVTFNQHGKNQPYGGMNEVGLVVEMLWLEQTAYPTNQKTAQFVNELELIQLLLDRCESVAEVEVQINQLNIFPIKGKIHYLISDAAGNSALLDFLNGKAYWRKSVAGQCIAITNNADYYAQAYYKRNPNTKKLRKRQSLPRFVLLNNEIKNWQQKSDYSALTQAQNMLEKAQLRSGKFCTRWSAIYDGNAKTIRFRHGTNGPWHNISLAQFDFFMPSQAMVLADKKPVFISYSPTMNENQLLHSFAGIGLPLVDVAEITKHQFGDKINRENSYSRNYGLLEIPVQLEDSLLRVLRFRLYQNPAYKKGKTVGLGDVRMRYSGKTAVWQFPGMPVGAYALLVFQDIDQNKKLGTEPYAFSGDQRLKNKQWPDFNQVRLELKAGHTQYPMHIRR